MVFSARTNSCWIKISERSGLLITPWTVTLSRYNIIKRKKKSKSSELKLSSTFLENLFHYISHTKTTVRYRNKLTVFFSPLILMLHHLFKRHTHRETISLDSNHLMDEITSWQQNDHCYNKQEQKYPKCFLLLTVPEDARPGYPLRAHCTCITQEG